MCFGGPGDAQRCSSFICLLFAVVNKGGVRQKRALDGAASTTAPTKPVSPQTCRRREEQRATAALLLPPNEQISARRLASTPPIRTFRPPSLCFCPFLSVRSPKGRRVDARGRAHSKLKARAAAFPTCVFDRGELFDELFASVAGIFAALHIRAGTVAGTVSRSAFVP